MTSPLDCSESFVDWLPTHLLVIHILMVFAVLNPVVLPFGTFYFFVEAGAFFSVSQPIKNNNFFVGVIKNQVCYFPYPQWPQAYPNPQANSRLR